jgi:hypothetical protein
MFAIIKRFLGIKHKAPVAVEAPYKIETVELEVKPKKPKASKKAVANTTKPSTSAKSSTLSKPSSKRKSTATE